MKLFFEGGEDEEEEEAEREREGYSQKKNITPQNS